MPMLDLADIEVLKVFMTHNIEKPFNPQYLTRFRRVLPVLLKDYEKLCQQNDALLKTNHKLDEAILVLDRKLKEQKRRADTE
mgnify:CR=1 FL=1